MTAMTSEVMEKVVVLLGTEYEVRKTLNEEPRIWCHMLARGLSDGDLLLTILNKAVELGDAVVLTYLFNAKVWAAGTRVMRCFGDTPLEAAILALSQMESTK